MFTLETDHPPATAVELAETLRRSVAKYVSKANVELVGELPELAGLSVDLSGGTVNTAAAPPDGVPTGAVSVLATVGSFSFTADPVTARGVTASVTASATQLQLDRALNAVGQVVLIPKRVSGGRLELRLSPDDLRAAVLLAAKTGASPHGVEVKSVDVSLTSAGPREVDVRLTLAAKKFVSLTVRVFGKLAIDDGLNAVATNLRAEGDGMAGNFAVGILRPQLQKLENQPFPLLSLPLGDIKLKDVAVDVTDGLGVTARFG